MYDLQHNLRMQKKGSSNCGRRAWNILRLALLRARKGGIFRNKVAISLRLLQKGVKNLRHPHGGRSGGALIYGERQLSFDETPITHIVKMHLPSFRRFKMPHIPCINPHVEFDYDFEYNNDDQEMMYYKDVSRKSFLKGVEYQEDHHDHIRGIDEVCEKIYGPSDEGIDLKAEQFIAKFYEQIKMQRQISYLQYSEYMHNGGSSLYEFMVMTYENRVIRSNCPVHSQYSLFMR